MLLMSRSVVATRWDTEVLCLDDELWWRKELVDGHSLFMLLTFETVVEGDVTRQASPRDRK